jgi:hypothetical protein
MSDDLLNPLFNQGLASVVVLPESEHSLRWDLLSGCTEHEMS